MSLRMRIITALPTLSSAEARIAERVLSDPGSLVGMNAAAIAEVCDTSSATVSRFCRSVGAGSFAAFRVEIAAEEARRSAGTKQRSPGRILGGISADDVAEEVFDKLVAADVRAVTQVAKVVDYPGIAVFADRLRAAARVLVFGVGSSGLVANDMCLKLNMSGISAVATSDIHAALMTTASFATDGIVVVISQSGRTTETLRVAETARDAGAPVFAITGAIDTPLKEACSYAIATSIEEPEVRSGGTASRLAMLVVVDLLFGLLMHGRGADSVSTTQRMHDALTTESRISIQR